MKLLGLEIGRQKPVQLHPKQPDTLIMAMQKWASLHPTWQWKVAWRPDIGGFCITPPKGALRDKQAGRTICSAL